MERLHDAVARVRSLAETQHGIVHERQLGSATHARRLAIEHGCGLTQVTPTVLRVSGSPRTALQATMVAVLDAGSSAVLSHHSAAALWGLSGFELAPHHVTAPRSRSGLQRSTVGRVHRPRHLYPHHVTRLDGVAVTTPSRLLFDLANVGLHPKRVERALDSAWAMGIVNPTSLQTVFRDLATQGRTGITLMRTLLADRGPGYRPTASGLEFRFRELLRRAGLPVMRRQVDVGDGQSWLGRMDFRDPEVPLIVEVDSDRYHTALTDRRHDEARRAALRAAGWTIIAVTEFEIWHRPESALRSISAARNQLLSRRTTR